MYIMNESGPAGMSILQWRAVDYHSLCTGNKYTRVSGSAREGTSGSFHCLSGVARQGELHRCVTSLAVQPEKATTYASGLSRTVPRSMWCALCHNWITFCI